MIAPFSPSTTPTQLTPREHQVLAEILTGRPNKTIASVLGISQRTVEVHRSRIFQKLGVRNAIQLAASVYHYPVGPLAASGLAEPDMAAERLPHAWSSFEQTRVRAHPPPPC